MKKTSAAKTLPKKDLFYAKLSFYLSLGFWVPMFNLAICAVSLYYGLRALKLIDLDERKFGGRTYAIIAIIISVTTIFATIVGTAFYLSRKINCDIPIPF